MENTRATTTKKIKSQIEMKNLKNLNLNFIKKSNENLLIFLVGIFLQKYISQRKKNQSKT